MTCTLWDASIRCTLRRRSAQNGLSGSRAQPSLELAVGEAEEIPGGRAAVAPGDEANPPAPTRNGRQGCGMAQGGTCEQHPSRSFIHSFVHSFPLSLFCFSPLSFPFFLFLFPQGRQQRRGK